MKALLGRVVIFTPAYPYVPAGVKFAALVVGIEGDGRLVLAVFVPPFDDSWRTAPPVGEVVEGAAVMVYVRGVVEGVGPNTWAWPERVS